MRIAVSPNCTLDPGNVECEFPDMNYKGLLQDSVKTSFKHPVEPISAKINATNKGNVNSFMLFCFALRQGCIFHIFNSFTKMMDIQFQNMEAKLALQLCCMLTLMFTQDKLSNVPW